jgi:hypothetical protein
VARGQAQDGTVIVLLRALRAVGASSTVRRLLTIAGIAVAGWLVGSAGLGGAAQAHADTVPVPAVAQLVNDVRGSGTTPISPVPESTAGGALSSAVPGARSAIHTLTGPVIGRPATPRMTVRAVRALRAPGVSWASRHREGAVAGLGGRAAHAAKATASGAPKDVRGAARKGHPAPVNPRPMDRQVPPAASGSVPPLGALGCVIRPGAWDARPALVLAPVLGAVPPAVHAATDEPALSPD